MTGHPKTRHRIGPRKGTVVLAWLMLGIAQRSLDKAESGYAECLVSPGVLKSCYCREP
jgi:hypothetical protein